MASPRRLRRLVRLLPSALLPVATALAACTGGATPIGDQASAPASAPGDATPAAPDPVVGVYHLSQVDATNLQLDADGTFRWTIEGCDYGGGQCGRWTKDAAGEIMLSAGDAELEWSWDGSFKQGMRWLRVSKTSDGVHVEGETTSSEHVRQEWKAGRACAVCGGNLGPTGQSECNDPLPDVCDR